VFQRVVSIHCARGTTHGLAPPCHPQEDITKVDQSAGKITIKHGPIKKLGMDAGMTVVYKAQDPAVLEAVNAGDERLIVGIKHQFGWRWQTAAAQRSVILRDSPVTPHCPRTG
jgi:hypothetical protein